MDPEQWKRIKALLDEALELAPEHRGAFLNEKCKDDPALRQATEALLQAHHKAQDFLEPIQVLETTEVSPPSPDETPERIRNYRILQKIGEGGMGIVYLAEQEKPVRRRVALKLIKLGMDTKQVVARFESERQALAVMNHSNVAKVFDAGATKRGRPYFAMEFVKGEPITSYCDKHRLTTKERLELFVQVCEGIQHAHQKGIIHRDIKPSNVLVCVEGDSPIAKIIDFGVAKATEQRLTERTVFTRLGVLIGTPEYMSPEQAEMTAQDIDTRTDVYSLGVVLYELLVGALPFDPKVLRRAGFDEIRRRIREDEPKKPSDRANSLSAESQEQARRRGTNPRSMTKTLRGELDWIVLKALEKDRVRRYSSASEFGADVGHFLQGSPVSAAPQSTWYQLRKLLTKNKQRTLAWSAIVLTFATIVPLALILTFVWDVNRERRLDRQRERYFSVQHSKLFVMRDAFSIKELQVSLDREDLRQARRFLQKPKSRYRGWATRHLESRARSLVEGGGLGKHGSAVLFGHKAAVASLAFSEDGSKLMSISTDGAVQTWSMQSLERESEGALGDVTVSGQTALAIQPGARLLAVGKDDGRTVVSSLDDSQGRVGFEVQSDGGGVTALSFSADGTLMVVATQRAVSTWNLASGDATLGSVREIDNVTALGVIAGALVSTTRPQVAHGSVYRIFMGSGDGTIESWNPTAPDETFLESFVTDEWIASVEKEPVLSVACLREAWLASGSTDGMVRVWHVSAGAEYLVLRGHTSPVTSVSWSPDRRWLASGSKDGAIFVWDSER